MIEIPRVIFSDYFKQQIISCISWAEPGGDLAGMDEKVSFLIDSINHHATEIYRLDDSYISSEMAKSHSIQMNVDLAQLRDILTGIIWVNMNTESGNPDTVSYLTSVLMIINQTLIEVDFD